MTVNGQEVLITLYDTPIANALYAALPMKLNFSDFNGTEKIAYPTEALPTEGEPDGMTPMWAICAFMRRGVISASSTRIFVIRSP